MKTIDKILNDLKETNQTLKSIKKKIILLALIVFVIICGGIYTILLSVT